MKLAYGFERRTCALAIMAVLACAGVASAQTTAIVATSNILSFAHQVGASTTPPPQTVRIVSAPASVTFNASVAYQNGQPTGWLQINNGTTATGTTGTGTQDLTLTANPASLPVGLYTAQVVLTSGGVQGSISVQLGVTATAQLRPNPGSLTLTIEPGVNSLQSINVTNTGAEEILFTSAVADVPSAQTGWLTATNTQLQSLPPGQTRAVGFSVQPGAAPTGTVLTGTIRLAPFTPNTSTVVTVPVAVNIGQSSTVLVSPGSVTFPYQINFQPPSVRSLSLTSSTQTQVGYTASIASAAPWLTLSLSPSGPGSTSVVSATPNPIYLIPNVAAVPQTPATLETTIRIDATNGTTQNIPVRLVLSTQAQLTTSADAVSFAHTLGATTPQPQTITVGTTSVQQQFTATPTYTNPANVPWFTVSQTSGLTPANLVVTLDSTRLLTFAAGTYTGSIRVQSASSVVDIPVTLTVSGNALLTIDSFPSEALQGTLGQTLPTRSFILRSTDSSDQPFTTTVEYGTGAANWLIVSPASGRTGNFGTSITYTLNPTSVTTAGTYEASIVITPTGVTGAAPIRVPIRYIATATTTVTPSPATIQVTQTGGTAPAAQRITLQSSTPGQSFAATSNQPWIQVNPATGVVPGPIDVTFNTASMAPGEYTGAVTVIVQGASPVQIPVSLRIQSGAALTATPTTLTFNAVQGQPAPATQIINLTSSGAAIAFTATASSTVSTANWLTVTPASGNTNATGGAAVPLTVAVNPQGLAPGTYQGVVTINTPNAATATTTVNVTLNVTSPSVPQNITIVNAATGQPRGIAPGTIITIKGRNLASSTATEGQYVNGALQTTVGETRVTFDGIAAPITYAGPSGDRQGDQVNAIVPYGISNRSTTNVVVEYRGVRSDAVSLRVSETDPGIFTTNQSGSGQGAILNQNNSVNSTSNAAQVGSVIQVFATGAGLMAPAGSDGRPNPTTAPFPGPLSRVTARVGNRDATIQFVGGAPGLVSGVLQVNIIVPDTPGLTSATVLPVEITVGGISSQPGVTVAVQPRQ